MWRKPDLSDESLGPTWSGIRTVLSSPERRRRILRWGVVSVAAAVVASVVTLILVPGGPSVNSWPFVAAAAVGAITIVLWLARLMLESLFPFEMGRGVYRWIAVKRRHRAWSKEAAQRDLFKR